MILDIRGVFCPMGCGETLHLMQAGVIRCLAGGCPQPAAAQKILANRETEHLVTFGADSWTVTHPLRDRLGDLPSCPVHEACNRLGGPPGGITGRYRARLTPDGALDLELLGVSAPNGQ